MTHPLYKLSLVDVASPWSVELLPMKALFFLSMLLTLSPAFAGESTTVHIATAAKTYPYVYACGSASGICGVEYELIQRACEKAGLSCAWQIRPWAGKDGPMGPGGLLYGLTQAAPIPPDYDLVVNSVSISADRRLELLFTMPYYDAYHIFIGKPGFSTREQAFGEKGFPADQPHFADPSRKLRILTYPGAMQKELVTAYGPNPRHVEIVAVSGDLQNALVQGQGDLLYAWTGIEKQVRDLVPGGDAYRVLSTSQYERTDPFNAVGAVAAVTREGRQLTEKLNNALVALRRAGLHKELFTSAFGVDLWPCQQAPYLEGDPKCAAQPK